MTKLFDCLGLGIAPVDILMQLKDYPKAGGKADAEKTTIQGGGPIPTAMVTLSRLGKKPALLSAVGDDVFGKFAIDELKNEKVDSSLIVLKKKPSAFAVGWVEKKSGRRSIVLDMDIAVNPNDIKINKLPKVRSIHIDGRYMPACLKLARWAKKHKVPIFMDVGSIRNDVSALFPLVDHLICSDDFALPYTKTKNVKSAIEKLLNICNGTIVVTSGTKGSIGFEENTGFARQKAFKVNAIDTTGAGDVYHGAYIFGFLSGMSLKDRMRTASAASAIKCTKPGGRTAIPTYNQIKNFIKSGAKKYA
ncbi:MAG: hypothetical protein GY865_09550 [candidate division Zixibacteria bacterium]|nr:hypothetical protein [candidate division Zixibacteria bacterium]